METTDLVPSCNSKLIIIQQGFAFSASLVLCFVMCDKMCYDTSMTGTTAADHSTPSEFWKEKKKKKAKSICTRKIKQVKNFLSRCSHCSKSRLITAMYYSIFCLHSHNYLQLKEFDLLYECCFIYCLFS